MEDTSTISYLNKVNFGCNSYSGSDMLAVMSIPGIEDEKGVYTLGSLQTLSVSTSMQRSPIRSIGNINAKDYVMGPRTIAGSLVFAVFNRHFAYEAMDAIRSTNNTYHFLADELPPFNISVVLANEYGAKSRLALYGVRLVNEGQVMSINDIYIENTYQFVARDYDYLEDMNNENDDNVFTEYDKLSADNNTDNEIETDSSEDFKDNNTKDNEILILYVETENAFYNHESYTKGKANFSLNIKKDYGYLIINNSQEKELFKINIAENNFPVNINLDNGIYYAYYYNDNTKTETIKFEIKLTETDNTIPNKPIILFQEQDNEKHIIGFKSSDKISKGIKYAEMINNNVLEYKSNSFNKDNELYLNVDLNKKYIFMSYNGQKESEKIEIYTNKEQVILFSDFYIYIKNNKNKIPELTYQWFFVHWEEIKNIAIKNNYFVVSLAIYIAMINDKNNEKDNYIYYLLEAIKYENKLLKFDNKNNILEAPIIIDYASLNIEFPKETKELKIIGYDNKIINVQKNKFSLKNNKFNYSLKLNEGFYKIKCISNNDIESNYLYLYVPEQKIRQRISNETFKQEKVQQENIDIIAVRNACFDKILKDTDNYFIFNEFAFNNNALINKISEPTIEINSNQEVIINVKNINLEKYYLCIDTADSLKDGQLTCRTLLNQLNNKFVYSKTKYGLIDNVRYCLWIETKNGDIISHINSFEFNNSNSFVTMEKNNYLIDDLKKYFSINDNISYIQSFYNYQNELNINELLNELIINNFNIPIQDINREKLIYDSINGKYDYYQRNKKIITEKIIWRYNRKKSIMELSQKIEETNFKNIEITFINSENIYSTSFLYSEFLSFQCDKDLIGLIIQYKDEDTNIYSYPITIDILNGYRYNKTKNKNVEGHVV